MSAPVRIGVLGAGAVAQYALFKPVSRVGGLDIVAVAARDQARAEKYAAEHGIPEGTTYQRLLDDPRIEAVYIALPNSLHCEWTLKALEAGKAVLCEKPLGANAGEAQIMADAGGLLMEALHWRYHPQSDRMKRIIADGQLGALRQIDFSFIVPGKYFQPDDIRFRLDLAGGATMDLGYYGVSFLRQVAGEPEAVIEARPQEIAPGVDGGMKAMLRFPGGCTARMDLTLVGETDDFVISADIVGEKGRMHIVNPVHPQNGRGLELEIDGARTILKPEPMPTYDWQALAFADNIRNGTPVRATGAEGVANMRVIDDIYRAAGMNPRAT